MLAEASSSNLIGLNAKDPKWLATTVRLALAMGYTGRGLAITSTRYSAWLPDLVSYLKTVQMAYCLRAHQLPVTSYVTPTRLDLPFKTYQGATHAVPASQRRRTQHGAAPAPSNTGCSRFALVSRFFGQHPCPLFLNWLGGHALTCQLCILRVWCLTVDIWL